MLSICPFAGIYVQNWQELSNLFMTDFSCLINFIKVENFFDFDQNLPKYRKDGSFIIEYYEDNRNLNKVEYAKKSDPFHYPYFSINDYQYDSIPLIFYFNCIIVTLLFFKVTPLTFWLIPPFLLLGSGIGLFLFVKNKG